MSIPVNQLVYAGEWDVATRYPQFWFVVSPLDNKAYVNVNVQPITGGADPSTVAPSAYWVLLNQTENVSSAYASFSSSQSQALPTATAVVPTFNVADVSPVGITAAIPTGNITIASAGVYKVSSIIQFFAATENPPTTSEVILYPVLSSVAVVNSSAYSKINSGDQSFLSVEWILTIGAANTILSFVCVSSGTSTVLSALDGSAFTPPIPNSPSIRTTIVRIA